MKRTLIRAALFVTSLVLLAPSTLLAATPAPAAAQSMTYHVQFISHTGHMVFDAQVTAVPGETTPVAIEKDVPYVQEAIETVGPPGAVGTTHKTKLVPATIKTGAWLTLQPDKAGNVDVFFETRSLDAMRSFKAPGSALKIDLPQITDVSFGETVKLVAGATNIMPLGLHGAFGKLILTRLGAHNESGTHAVTLAPATGSLEHDDAYVASASSTSAQGATIKTTTAVHVPN